MEHENLKFSYNWNNKLYCKSFSTIRLRNDSKYQLDYKFRIWLHTNKEPLDLSFAKVVYIKHIVIDNLTEPMARLDTGYNRDECIKLMKTMYKNIVKDWKTQLLSFMILVKE